MELFSVCSMIDCSMAMCGLILHSYRSSTTVWSPVPQLSLTPSIEYKETKTRHEIDTAAYC
jgi:hypothetical protein